MALAINPPSPLVTPTYDGSGQVVHPSVIDAVRLLGTTWNGHRYWMGVTPYPNTNDDFENPSILVSDDKVTWVVPSGLTNPVVPQPTGAGRHHSDTDLLMEPDGSFLHMFYRESGTGSDIEERIYVVSSSDGVTWSSPTLAFQTGDNTDKELFLSPASLKLNGTYHLYGVRASGRGIAYKTAPAVTGPWSATQVLDAGEYNGLEPWHMACHLSDVGSVVFTMQVTPGGRAADGEIWLAESPAPGENLIGVAQVLVSISGWDNQLYRGCMIKLENAGGYGLYYSARNGDTWHVGYVEFQGPIPTLEFLQADLTKTIPNVKVDENFEARIRAESASGAGPWSLWVPARPDNENTPVNVATADVGADGALITWEKG